MNSTRLPGKIMLKVKNQPLIKYHTDRLRWSNLPLFIATTINPEDDVICDYCISNNIQFYRGDEFDVLKRYYECASIFNLDIIIRVTSDCPLIDGFLIKQAVDEFRKLNIKNIYYSNVLTRTFPRGFDFEMFTFEDLAFSHKMADSIFQREHVTPYINNNVSGKINIHHFKNHFDSSKFRITLDTPEDFILIKKLIEDHNCEVKTVSEIIKLMELHGHLHQINQHIDQKKA